METTKLTVKLTHRPTIHIGKMGYTSVNDVNVPLVTLCGHPKDLSAWRYCSQHIQEWESTIGHAYTCKKCEQSLNKLMDRWFVEGNGDSFSYFLNKELELRRNRTKHRKVRKSSTSPVKNPVIGIDRRTSPNECHAAGVNYYDTFFPNKHGFRKVYEDAHIHLTALSMTGQQVSLCSKNIPIVNVSYEECPRITCSECVELFKKFNISENPTKRDRTLEQRKGMIKAEVVALADFLKHNEKLIKEVCKRTDFKDIVTKEFYDTLVELPAAITRVKYLVSGIKLKKFKGDLGLEKELLTISQFWG